MATSKNQTRTLPDLNKEPEADDDAKHEDDVASESAISEDKDANQEDESSCLPINRNRAENENETKTEIMASAKNITRILLDLNKEPETDDDAKHEDDVAFEPAISEDKDANQEDESSLPINRNRAENENENENKTEIMASTTRILLDEDDDHEEADDDYDVNQEEEDEDEDVDDEEADEDYDLNQEEEEDEYDDDKEADEDYDVNKEEEKEGKEHLKRHKASAVAKEQSKKRKLETKDDSETLTILSRWETQELPPEQIVSHSLIEECSRPIRKQLAKDDIRQRRLRLSKSQMDKKFHRFLQLLAGTTSSRGKKGSTVSVYGPDGQVHEMQMSPDLTKGWTEFVREYELEAHCDFVTVWMFKNRASRKICVAIDTKTFAITKPVSKRISKAAFEDDSD